MTRATILICTSRAALSQFVALLSGQPMFEVSDIDISQFCIPLPSCFFDNQEIGQKFFPVQNTARLLKLSRDRKIESQRMFLPYRKVSSSIKRSCHENSSGRRVGRRNGSR